MLTCGMYDRSGEFAVRVGIPSKSGVGGGYTLEYLSEHLNLHILDSADAKEA